MAVTYGFFNSVNGDRKYNADQMSEYFRGIVSQGVFQHLDSGMAVSAGTGLSVSVAAGRAIIQNRWVQNSAALNLTISDASETYGRKDAVVIRLNKSSRAISIAVKTGTPAASPVAPEMTRTDTTYEMALAYVNVAAGASSVTVTDKRSDSSVCGWASVAQATSGEVDQMLNDMKTGFDGVVYPSPVEMVQGCDQKLRDALCPAIPVTYSGKYVTLNQSKAYVDSPTDLAAYNCYIAECMEGDKFLVSAKGGDAPRSYGFISADGTVLVRAAENANLNSQIVTAPTGSKYIVINDSDGRTSYYGYKESLPLSYEHNIEKLEQEMDHVYVSCDGYVDNISLNSDTIAIGPSNRSLVYPCKPNTRYIITRSLVLTHFVAGTTTVKPTDVGITINKKETNNFGKKIEITTGANDNWLILWFYNVNDDSSTPFDTAKNDIYTIRSYMIDRFDEIDSQLSELVKTNIVTVAKDSSGDYSTIKAAIDYIGNNATSNNTYEIHVYPGTYDVYTELGGDAWYEGIVDTSNNRQGLIIKDHVSLIGHGDVILEFLPEDSKATLANTTCVSPLEVYGNSKIENIRIKAKNCRYCIHDETGNSVNYNYSKHSYNNVSLEHLGNKSGCWVSSAAIASGTSSGCQYFYENCSFKSSSFYAWSIHNNENQTGNEIVFDGCEFDGYFTGAAVKIAYYKQNAATNVSNVFIKNCTSTYKFIVRPETGETSTNVWNVHNFTDIVVDVE